MIAMLSKRQMILGAALHYWRINLAVALAVSAATAVLTGALIVGDSMRGSLRDLALSRLGWIDSIVLADRFFRADLATELQANNHFATQFGKAHPAFLLQVTLEQQTAGQEAQAGRASGVLVWGLDDKYSEIGAGGPASLPGPGEIVLNEPLARELGAVIGDLVVVRLPKLNQIPSDTPFGHKVDIVRNLAGLQVTEIIPAQGIGRFGLNPTQHLPLNAFVKMSTIASALEQPGQANAILVTSKSPGKIATVHKSHTSKGLPELLRPTLSDYGFQVHEVRQTFRPQPDVAEQLGVHYMQLTSDRMLIPPEVDAALAPILADYNAQHVLTYLANTIQRLDLEPSQKSKKGAPHGSVLRNEIPYSTVTAIDATLPLGPLSTAAEETIFDLKDDEIVLNSWTASQLGVAIGEVVQLKYFVPETTHGQTEEATATFRVRDIVNLVEPAKPYRNDQPAVYRKRPTLANDPHLTPEVEGFTDRESIADWDPPFPFNQRRITDHDERYWDYYRTTPKGFVSYTTGKKLWGTNRFGTTTSYRMPAQPDRSHDKLSAHILEELRQPDLHPGFLFLPVREQGLQAAAGTTSFSGLFLGFSFFLIAAALMLVVLLFRLGIGQRVREVGLLYATGWNLQQVTRLLMSEAILVAGAGALCGVLGGIFYAWLMIVGLRTWWLAAVVTPFLQLHITPASLWIGGLSSVIAASVSIRWSLRRLKTHSLRAMLAGEPEPMMAEGGRLTSTGAYALGVLISLGLSLIVLGTFLSGEAQAGCFFGCGATMLTASLLWVSRKFRSYTDSSLSIRRLTLASLAVRNTARRPGRSTLTIGLVACAVFLIGAISCFQLEPSLEGTGGFDLVGTSDRPIHADLNTQQGRAAVGLIGDDVEQLLSKTTTVAFRLNTGDDASCLNLYQPSRPSILGVPPLLIQLHTQSLTDANHHPAHQFRWAETLAETEAEQNNPWLLLDKEFPDGAVPVVLDKNTAMYSMHLFTLRGAGTAFEVEHEDGRTVRYRIVGLLSNSILQGKLLIAATQFKRLFPEIGGYRYFLTKSNDGYLSQTDKVTSVLEGALNDQGLDLQPAIQVVESLLAVQNTYLMTFQSLGALGLLLGTFGLATVQLRNVMERQGELAVMRSSGFRLSRLAWMVLLENTNLLLLGLLAGLLAATMAVLPHWLLGGASVPWAALAKLFGVVFLVGLAGGLLAVRAVVLAPLLPALRKE